MHVSLLNMTCRSLLEFASPIVAAGDDERVVTVEVDRSDGKGVSRDGVKALLVLTAQIRNGFIKGTGDDEVGLGLKLTEKTMENLGKELALPLQPLPSDQSYCFGDRTLPQSDCYYGWVQ